MKTIKNKKWLIAMIAIGAAIAVVIVVAGSGKRRQEAQASAAVQQSGAAQRASASEKQTRLENVSGWGDDNTVYIDGELYGFDHRIDTWLFIGTDAS